MEASLLLPHTVLQGHVGISENYVFPFGTLSQTLDLDFAMVSQSCYQQNFQWSSLSTTPIQQLTSCGCLLVVGHL